MVVSGHLEWFDIDSDPYIMSIGWQQVDIYKAVYLFIFFYLLMSHKFLTIETYY